MNVPLKIPSDPGLANLKFRVLTQPMQWNSRDQQRDRVHRPVKRATPRRRFPELSWQFAFPLHALQGAGVPVDLWAAASIAKAWCSEAYFFNAGTGIQLHGGVGFTWEYDIQLYFKRAKSSEAFLGNSAWHRERIARQLLD